MLLYCKHAFLCSKQLPTIIVFFLWSGLVIHLPLIIFQTKKNKYACSKDASLCKSFFYIHFLTCVHLIVSGYCQLNFFSVRPLQESLYTSRWQKKESILKYRGVFSNLWLKSNSEGEAYEENLWETLQIYWN